jgi:hypothetical protein
MFFEDTELFIDNYFKMARSQNDEDLVFEVAPPAYHNSPECERLHADYRNYEIPEQIRAREATEPGIRMRFRQWFKENCYLLENTGPKYRPEFFILRIRAAFGIDIRDIRDVVRPNSGVTSVRNTTLSDLQSEIDQVLQEAGKWFYATAKNTAILRQFQKRTYLAYKPQPLPDNRTGYPDEEVRAFLKDYDSRFKRPLKTALIMYYRMRYNPELEFAATLLDQVGFLPCRRCHETHNRPEEEKTADGK